MECKPKRGNASFLLPKEFKYFAAKKSKYMKGKTKTREPLTLCIDIRAEQSIKKKTQKEDFALLGISDFIASEARYHGSCYRQYLKINYEQKEETPAEKEVYKTAYKKVVQYCYELQSKGPCTNKYCFNSFNTKSFIKFSHKNFTD